MKKLMFAMAVAAAGAAMAEGISSGIVGYNVCNETQYHAEKDMYSMLAIPFEGVDGKGVSLNDLNFSNPTKNNGSMKADRILLWVADGKGIYDYEYWFLSKSDGWKKADGSGVLFDEAYPDGLPAGTTFWYLAYKGKEVQSTLTTSGAVVPDDSVVKTISRGQYNFVSYPYPTTLKLDNEAQVDWGLATKNNGSMKADNIILWKYNESTKEYDYEFYFLSKSAGWKAADGSGRLFKDVYPEGVTVGTGFWYSAQAAGEAQEETFEVTFKSPLAKVQD